MHFGPVLMAALAAAVRPPFVVELPALAGLVRLDHDLDVIERQKSLVGRLLKSGQGTEDDMVGLRRQLEADARLGAVGQRGSARDLGRREDLSSTSAAKRASYRRRRNSGRRRPARAFERVIPIARVSGEAFACWLSAIGRVTRSRLLNHSCQPSA